MSDNEELEHRLLRFMVSPSSLKRALRIPETTEIVRVESVWEDSYQGYLLEVVVSDPEFPVMPEGEQVPLVTPALTDYPARVVWDWSFNPHRGEEK